MAALVVPIMFDLALGENGEVIPGPGTQKALDQAIEVIQELDDHAIVFLSASVPPDPKWKGERMADVCARYLERIAPDIGIVRRNAKTFNTFGELDALARHLNPHNREGARITAVYITVKRWHAPRVRMIARGLFAHHRVSIPLRIRTHPLQFSWGLFVHEVAGFVKNRIQLSRM